MKQKKLSFIEYKSYATGERANYLNEHVNDTTDLSPDFCEDALEWETYSVARWYLIRAVGILRIRSAIPLVLKICREPNEKFSKSSLHLIAAWALGRIGEDALEPLILELKTSKNVQMTVCIVDALGEIGSPEAIPSLDDAFRKKEPEVKLWAALSLMKIGKRALDTLYNLYSDSRDLAEIILVLDAIAKINDDSSKPFVKKVLREGSEEERKFILSNCAHLLDH